MNGRSPNEIDHRAVIESWFNSVVSEGGIERYDDLHVDEIDPAWKPRSRWISSALESFDIALQVRDTRKGHSRLAVVLAFALEADVRPIGRTFGRREDLEKSLSSTPPSLYIFRPGGEFWVQVEEANKSGVGRDVTIEKFSFAELFGEARDSIKCVYLEHKRRGDDEYSRDLYLAG